MTAPDYDNGNSKNTAAYTLIAAFVIVLAVLIFLTVRFRNQIRLRSVVLRTRLQTARGGGRDVEHVEDVEHAEQLSKPITPHVLEFIPITVYQSKEQPNVSLEEVREDKGKGVKASPSKEISSPPPIRPSQATKDSFNNIENCASEDLHFPVCCICIEDILVGQRVRVLPCEHFYHVACVDGWFLSYSKTCPIWYLRMFYCYFSNSNKYTVEPIFEHGCPKGLYNTLTMYT
jgi:hypothetical protein